MNEKEFNELIEEIKNMDDKQLEQAKKDIEDIIRRIDNLSKEDNND